MSFARLWVIHTLVHNITEGAPASQRWGRGSPEPCKKGLPPAAREGLAKEGGKKRGEKDRASWS